MLGKKSACQVRQDQLSNPPNYFVLHFRFIYFMATQKRLSPDPIVGLGTRPRLSQEKYKVVDRTITTHTLKPIKIMKTVAMDIRLYVATNINIVNQFKDLVVKMLFTNSWKGCSKRLNTAKVLLRKSSTNHW